ncbi:hypothetical protein B0T22DRAFT_300281 [Podospora appendiculata]|uniref:Uncharacterized protein n=1 Tax=Podospora appendiculata TaxID=314037 RepID=A0AAE0X0G1_9PEZI|nr:hypothetical protein B0T22DRAFT_300281 [Podospora appendiculata]
MQDFDNAGRSVLGSLGLIGRVVVRAGTEPGIVALVGAFTTVLSIAVGPFTQQAIRTTACPQILPGVHASLPVAHYVPANNPYFSSSSEEDFWEVDVDMKATMIRGLTNPQSNDSAIIASCSTGNCTFPDYGTGVTHASMGLCSRCIDTTSKIQGPQGPSYSNGGVLLQGDILDLSLDICPWWGPSMSVGTDWSFDWATDLFTEGFAEAANNSIAKISVLVSTMSPCSNETGTFACPRTKSVFCRETENKLPFGGMTDFIATSCVLYPCFKQYKGAVVGGVFREEVVSTALAIGNSREVFEGNFQSENWDNLTAVQSPCIVDDSGTWYTHSNMSSAPQMPGRTWTNITLDGKNATVPNACLYKLQANYASAMQNFMSKSVFTDNCHMIDEQMSDSFEIECDKSWWFSSLFRQKNASFQTISSAMDDFATVITNKFRTAGSGPDDFMSHGTVQGAVVETTACVHFDWRWLALPLGLVAMSAALLAWMIVRSSFVDSRQPVWKGSVLPLLFYGMLFRDSASDPVALHVFQPHVDTLPRSGLSESSESSNQRFMDLHQIQQASEKIMVRFDKDGV